MSPLLLNQATNGRSLGSGKILALIARVGQRHRGER